MVKATEAIGNKFSISDKDIFGWSDSTVSLCRIRQVNKIWRAWVQNTAVLIRKFMGIDPADVATWMISPKKFGVVVAWLEFLIH